MNRDQAMSSASTALIRSRIADLSALDRQLVILHFGAGLSVDEIGHTYKIPHHTVAFRVKRAAELLRAWVSALDATARLDARHIGDAICSGFRAPSGLYRKIEPQLHQAPNFRSGSRVSPFAFVLKFPRLVISLCRALSCGERPALPQSK
jgi:hypothetical protein